MRTTPEEFVDCLQLRNLVSIETSFPKHSGLYEVTYIGNESLRLRSLLKNSEQYVQKAILANLVDQGDAKLYKEMKND